MVANSRKWKDRFLIKRLFILAALCAAGASSHAADRSEHTVLPLWGGTEVQELTLENDLRFLDVSMPLPAVPYFPKLSYHRQAFETKSKIGDWKSGGAHSIKAHLPFGLTFEAGHRLDGFGNRDDEFVGITFTYSHLRDHHKNLHYGRLDTKRHASQSGSSGESSFSGRFWSIAGPFAIGAAIGLLIEDDSKSVRSRPSTAVVGNIGSVSTDNSSDDDYNSADDSASTTPNPTPIQSGSNDWNLVWQDEFDGNSLDTVNNWSLNDMYLRDLNDRGATACFGGGNGEAQCYTGRPDNVSVSNGNLELTALIETYTATNNYGDPATRGYTSGRIHTRLKRDFKYGRFEARIKLPKGQGTFPAFWMLPTDNTYGFWPNSGEIDIMENGSGGPSIGGAIHYLSPQANHHTYQTRWIPAEPEKFNVYRVDWHPDEIRWYLNGQPYWTAPKTSWRDGPHAVGNSDNAPFDQDFHIVLNLAIGGSIGGAITNSEFPDGGHKMLVDYVRVYECDGGPNACKYSD